MGVYSFHPAKGLQLLTALASLPRLRRHLDQNDRLRPGQAFGRRRLYPVATTALSSPHRPVLRRHLDRRVQVVLHPDTITPRNAAVAKDGAVVHVGNHQRLHVGHIDRTVFPMRYPGSTQLRSQQPRHRLGRLLGHVLGCHGFGPHRLSQPGHLEPADGEARKDWYHHLDESWCHVSFTIAVPLKAC